MVVVLCPICLGANVGGWSMGPNRNTVTLIVSIDVEDQPTPFLWFLGVSKAYPVSG